MTQVAYSSQFTGQFTPANDDGTSLKGRTIAPDAAVVAERLGIEGRETLGRAEVRSTIIYTSEDTFQQYGVITFGDGKDTLHFSTKGQGQVRHDADSGMKFGAAMLRVDHGHGRFEKATGLITSNFVVNDNGEVSDSQVGLVNVER